MEPYKKQKLFDFNSNDYTNDDIEQDEESKEQQKSLQITKKKMYLPDPSDEQLNIIQMIGNEQNVVIDAVAGSGKTTLILLMAQLIPQKKFLVLLYNANLKHETNDKIEQLGLKNVSCRSYHSAFGYIYRKKCNKDEEILRILQGSQKPQFSFDFDVLICDEIQDMTNMFYQIVCKVWQGRLRKNQAQICLIGDYRQCIYKFLGADERFLLEAKTVFKFPDNNLPFQDGKLSCSFRVSKNIARFVNEVCFKKEVIKCPDTAIQGPKIRYVQTDPYDDSIILQEIERQLRRENITGDDIFILFNSTKQKSQNSKSLESPSQKILTKLKTEYSKKRISYYVYDSDVETNSQLMQNKLCVLSYFVSKGLERKVVIVHGFDSSYFKFIGKDLPKDRLPNIFYVALTRAKEQLIIFQGYQKNLKSPQNNCSQMPFLDLKVLREQYNDPDGYIEFPKLYKQLQPPKFDQKIIERRVSPTEIVQHFPSQDLFRIVSKVDSKQYVNEEENFQIKLEKQVKMQVNQGVNIYEGVSNLNGIAVTLYFEKKIKGISGVFNSLQSQKNSNQMDKILQSHWDKFQIQQDKLEEPEQILKLATFWFMYVSKHYFKANQLKSYNWVENQELEACFKRMKEQMSENLLFEQEITCIHSKVYELIGFVDIIDVENDTLWEIKCVEELDQTHRLQLLIYMYIYSQISKEQLEKIGLKPYEQMKFKLFNVLNNTIEEIKYSKSGLKELTNEVLHIKYERSDQTIPDVEFISDVEDIMNDCFT